jgi:hypothetical protein
VKYFKKPDGSLWAFAQDGSQDQFITEDMTAATAEEVALLTSIAPPPPLTQIRALEAQYADAQARVTRQSLLSLALERAMADPLAEGLTSEQVHATLAAADNGYAALFALEQQVAALRALI